MINQRPAPRASRASSPVDAGGHDCRIVHPITLVPSGDSSNVTMGMSRCVDTSAEIPSDRFA
jgi:hypothetical protein